MYEAAVRYYLQHETMDAIGRQLRMSRSSVSRLLSRARETGLVQITVAASTPGSQTARRLAAELGVRVHLASAGDASPTERLDRVSRLAASLLQRTVRDHQVVGAAWGVTVSRVVQHLAPTPRRGVTVVQLNGGSHGQAPDSPQVGALLASLGAALDAPVVPFPVPAFFDYAATRQAMWRERSVRQVLDLQRRADLAVFGVGCFHGAVPSHVYAGGYLDADELARLEAEGAVGDVCTVLLREDGSWADIPGNDRATGLSPDDLRQVPTRVCVVADPLRVPALTGALRAQVVTDLVCDDATAAALADRLGLG